MSTKVYLRYVVVPLALAGLLILTTTFGVVWHHHASNTEQNCPICHFNHQPLENSLAGCGLPVLAPLGASATIAKPSSEIEPSIRRVPARAPPSA